MAPTDQGTLVVVVAWGPECSGFGVWCVSVLVLAWIACLAGVGFGLGFGLVRFR